MSVASCVLTLQRTIGLLQEHEESLDEYEDFDQIEQIADQLEVDVGEAISEAKATDDEEEDEDEDEG